MKSCKSFFLLKTIVFFLVAVSVYAEQTTVAVATNFSLPAKELVAVFEENTGHKVRLSFASTGKLYIQIAHGAPFDVFLAADTLRPIKAEEEGLAVRDSRLTYAIGKIALYSVDKALMEESSDVLYKENSFRKLAIANPVTAPYGRAAIEVIKNLQLHDVLSDKIVRGDNIAQAYQFVSTGNAALGFVALSQVIDNEIPPLWVVPENLYTPIEQDAVLLKHGENNLAAHAFMTFLNSPKAISIIQKYGYGTALGSEPTSVPGTILK